jgi:major membrane immunogen (membrane-anchored lipoprotein)
MRDINTHQVTITVELGDGTIVQKVQEFRGGNPRFHAKEADEAITKASKSIQDGLAGMYGDIRESRAV